MFSISFGEMMVILVLGLIVVGPERLPGAARFVGHLFGRIQRQVTSIKRDIKREMDLADLREAQASYEKVAKDVTRSIKDSVTQMEGELSAQPVAKTEAAEGEPGGKAPEAGDLAGQPAVSPRAETAPHA